MTPYANDTNKRLKPTRTKYNSALLQQFAHDNVSDQKKLIHLKTISKTFTITVSNLRIYLSDDIRDCILFKIFLIHF